jgi:hypothetical protein
MAGPAISPSAFGVFSMLSLPERCSPQGILAFDSPTAMDVRQNVIHLLSNHSNLRGKFAEVHQPGVLLNYNGAVEPRPRWLCIGVISKLFIVPRTSAATCVITVATRSTVLIANSIEPKRIVTAIDVLI